MRLKKGSFIVSLVAVSVGILALACSSASPSSTATQPPVAAAQPTAAPTSPPPQPTVTTPSQSQPTPTAEAQTSPPAQETAGAFAWTIEEIDTGTKPSLALTTDDVPNVAYMLEAQDGFVRNAVRNGSTWDISDVVNGYFYGPLDIAIGPDDVPHIVYHDHQDSSFKPDKGDAILSSLENGEWKFEKLFDDGHDGWDTRITVDSEGGVHISAIDPLDFGGNGVEYYSKDDSGKWIVEDIGSGPQTYKYATSIAVDPQGNPHITFFDQDDKTLALASRDDSGWSINVVDGERDAGLFSSLIIDSDGRFHVSYLLRQSQTSGIVRYATRGADDMDWEISDVGSLDKLSFGFVGARHITSLALDSEGNPWIAYSDEEKIMLAVWDGSAWQTQTAVDAEGKILGQLVVLKVDSKDQPHLTYFEVTSKSPLNGRVMYAKGARQ